VKLLIMQVSQPFVTFTLLAPNILLNTSLSNTLNQRRIRGSQRAVMKNTILGDIMPCSLVDWLTRQH
jgi:hypothetical protein